MKLEETKVDKKNFTKSFSLSIDVNSIHQAAFSH
jgi:hypothetical protein